MPARPTLLSRVNKININMDAVLLVKLEDTFVQFYVAKWARDPVDFPDISHMAQSIKVKVRADIT